MASTKEQTEKKATTLLSAFVQHAVTDEQLISFLNANSDVKKLCNVKAGNVEAAAKKALGMIPVTVTPGVFPNFSDLL